MPMCVHTLSHQNPEMGFKGKKDIDFEAQILLHLDLTRILCQICLLYIYTEDVTRVYKLTKELAFILRGKVDGK